MRKDIILSVKNLNVAFDKEVVVKNLNFKVRVGEFISIIGPNGSGKSTLLKALLNLIPYEGEIKWKENIKINYLPQWFSKEKFSIIPMSVKDFFYLKTKDEETIKKAVNTVGLEYSKIMEKNPSELSTGQFQRLLIAWTFIDNPDVVLLDEPTTGIDVGGEKTIYDLLYKMWKERKTTIFMVTHEINVVYYYSTSVLCLHKRCLSFGKPNQVLNEKLLSETYGMKIKFHMHRGEE